MSNAKFTDWIWQIQFFVWIYPFTWEFTFCLSFDDFSIKCNNTTRDGLQSNRLGFNEISNIEFLMIEWINGWMHQEKLDVKQHWLEIKLSNSLINRICYLENKRKFNHEVFLLHLSTRLMRTSVVLDVYFVFAILTLARSWFLLKFTLI